MKIPDTLLLTMTLGIGVAALQTSCHKDDVKSARHHQKKEMRKEARKGYSADNCPACGRG